MLFTLENEFCSYVRGVSGMALFMYSFSKTKAAIFVMRSMLLKDFSFPQMNRISKITIVHGATNFFYLVHKHILNASSFHIF